MAESRQRRFCAQVLRQVASGVCGLASVLFLAGCGAEDRAAGNADAGAPSTPLAVSDDEGLRAAVIAARQAEGAADPSYHLRQSDRGAVLMAANSTWRLRSDLALDGVTIAAEDESFAVTLRTRSIGCGATRHEIAPGSEPRAAAGQPNRAEYRQRAGDFELNEWWVNGPLGFEQGYTLPASPCAPGAASELDIAIDVSGLTPALSDPSKSDAREVELRDGAGLPLARITDLHAKDATGRTLSSAFDVRDGQLVYRVATAGATWPIEIDPIIAGIQAMLQPNVSTYLFGRAVAINGSTALVSSPPEASNGAVYVFVRSANVWTLQQKLTASDGAADDFFGYAVALAGDTAVIGAPFDDVGVNTNQGSAYVFVRSGSTWSQQAKLASGNPAANMRFGHSVAISGETALVGQPGPSSPTQPGAGYVFVRNAGVWSQQAKIGSHNEAGFSVALDLDTAVLGAPNGGGSGTAQAYFRTGASWAWQANFGAGPSGTKWGFAVGVSGNMAFVGAPGTKPSHGNVYVYERTGISWSFKDAFGAPSTSVYAFGSAVALKGNTGVVGASDCGGTCAGRAYVYVLNGTWSSYELAPTPDTSDMMFGYSVALETDTIVVGAPQYSAAYVFVPVGQACTTGSQCGTGYCFDSVCCDRDCSGSCDSCSVAAGAAVDGICKVYPAGSAGSPSCGTLICSGTSGQCSTCASDSQCAADRYCDATGNCQLRKGNATACNLSQGADCKNADCRACQSNNCVDGYCCDTACAAACDVCSAALGASANGTCSTAPAGTNTLSCSAPFACNGSAVACPSTCSSDVDCAADHYCPPSGTCAARKALGYACSTVPGSDCKVGGCRVCSSGNCVDGRCCNSACTETCAACNLAGKEGSCSALADSTVPDSPGCSGYLCNGTLLTCPSTCAGSEDCTGGYYCFGTSCLPSGCAADSECASDRYCAADGMCKLRKAQSSACNAAAGGDCLLAGCRVCSTNNCVDGYCCNTACAEKCGACNLGSKEGTCSPLTDGATPDAPGCSGYLCDGSLTTCASTCASDSDCDSAHYCFGSQCLVKGCATDSDCASTYYCASDANCKPRKTQGSACNASSGGDCNVLGCRVCQSNNCVDGYCCNSACTEPCATCSATGQQGVCNAYADNSIPDAPGCSGYKCGGSATCPTTCASDVDCMSTHYCSGNQCLPKACTSDTDCASTHYCAQGGQCTGRKGNGSACNVAAGADCSVVGCRVCSSNNCVDGYCCNAACSEPCGTCAGSSPGLCSALPDGATPDSPGCNGYLCGGSAVTCPPSCATDVDCASTHYCASGACVTKKGAGEACTASSQCGDPSFPHCADGVCCNTTCTGKCLACAAANKQSGGAAGTCDAAKQGTNPNNGCIASGDPCADQASCSGTAGLCAKGAYGTSCGPTSCASATTVSGKICDGTGTCIDQTNAQCAPYLCKSGACASPCATSNDCTTGYYCASGACVAQSDNGKACSTATSCKSGFCVDGVCCDAPCSGQCEACAETGSVGQCKTVSGPPRGSRPACTGSAACAGSCNGANPTACTMPGAGTPCGAAQCLGDVAQPAGSCDGNGTCAVPTSKPCLPYGCESSSGACKTSCTTATDCSQGAVCDTTTNKCAIAAATCQDSFTVKLPNGQTQSCAPYKCVGGACQQQCTTSGDCAPGYDCQSSQCVQADGGAAGTGGGAGAGGSSTGGTGGSGGAGGTLITGGSTSTGGTTSGGGSGGSTGGSSGVDSGAGTAGSAGNGSPASDDGGCGCRVAGEAPARDDGRFPLLALAALFAARRRRRGATRHDGGRGFPLSRALARGRRRGRPCPRCPRSSGRGRR